MCRCYNCSTSVWIIFSSVAQTALVAEHLKLKSEEFKTQVFGYDDHGDGYDTKVFVQDKDLRDIDKANSRTMYIDSVSELELCDS